MGVKKCDKNVKFGAMMRYNRMWVKRHRAPDRLFQLSDFDLASWVRYTMVRREWTKKLAIDVPRTHNAPLQPICGAVIATPHLARRPTEIALTARMAGVRGVQGTVHGISFDYIFPKLWSIRMFNI